MTKETTLKLMTKEIEYVSKKLLLLKVQIETMESNESFNDNDANSLVMELFSTLNATAKRVDHDILSSMN